MIHCFVDDGFGGLFGGWVDGCEVNGLAGVRYWAAARALYACRRASIGTLS